MHRNKKESGRWKIIRRILVLLLGICIFVFAGLVCYVRQYYHAGREALLCVQEDSTVQVGKEYIAFIPDEIQAGFILYPGAKVEYTAYAPLMKKLADKGILSIIPHLTGNIAFLDMDAAKGIPESFPEVDTWFIGGHSLGGVAASDYVKAHRDLYSGLILLASYSVTDLKDSGLRILSVYGDKDEVMDSRAYQKNMEKNISDYTEYVIHGGNHAQFGDYGQQEGDGEATISEEEQLEQTVREIVSFIDEEKEEGENLILSHK